MWQIQEEGEAALPSTWDFEGCKITCSSPCDRDIIDETGVQSGTVDNGSTRKSSAQAVSSIIFGQKGLTSRPILCHVEKAAVTATLGAPDHPHWYWAHLRRASGQLSLSAKALSMWPWMWFSWLSVFSSPASLHCLFRGPLWHKKQFKQVAASPPAGWHLLRKV